MILFPIVERELRVASRRGGTYWLRVGGAGLAILIGIWVYLILHRQSTAGLSRALFQGLAVLMFGISILAGPLTTADSLSAEKRDGTLGLLFLTDLKGWDVVFGKLAAHSFKIVLLLLAMAPLLAIPMLMGGVSLREWGRVAAACANAALISLALGLLASALCADERKAIGWTVAALIVLCAGLPVLSLWLFETRRIAVRTPWFLQFSPAYVLAMAMGAPAPARSGFWLSAAAGQMLAWGSVLAACLYLPRSWQERGLDSSGRGWRGWLTRARYGSPQARADRRKKLLQRNPVLWLASRNRLQGRMVWAFLAMSAALWLWGWIEHRHDWLDPANYMMTAIVLNTLLKVWIISESCRCFAEARAVGAMELVLTTPLTVTEMLRGQALALARHFGKPAAAIFAADLVFLWAGLADMSPGDDDRVTWVMVFAAGLLVYAADLIAISLMGMWEGLRQGRANRAIGRTLGLILVLPWAGFGASMAILAALEETRTLRVFRALSRNNLEEEFVLGVWLAWSLAVSVYFGWSSWVRLHRDYRAVCAQPLGSGRNVFQRLWEKIRLNR